MNNDKALSDIDLSIFKVLVEWIQKHKSEYTPLTYTQLVDKIDNPSVIPVNIGARLGRVSTYCKEHGAPAISAIVISLDTGEPGAGFFELLGINVKPEDRVVRWIPLHREAFDYDKWNELLEQAKSE